MKNHLMPIFITQIKQILEAARQNAYKAINTEMVNAYWHVGKRIVEEEQNGQERATYGKQLLKTLSEELTASFGKGFTERSLREYRQFYLLFDDFEIRRTLYAKLSWSNFYYFFNQHTLNWLFIILTNIFYKIEFLWIIGAVQDGLINENQENSWVNPIKLLATKSVEIVGHSAQEDILLKPEY
jgi:hypothetical protein